MLPQLLTLLLMRPLLLLSLLPLLPPLRPLLLRPLRLLRPPGSGSSSCGRSSNGSSGGGRKRHCRRRRCKPPEWRSAGPCRIAGLLMRPALRLRLLMLRVWIRVLMLRMRAPGL